MSITPGCYEGSPKAIGYHSWSLDVSHEGIRNYKILFQVQSAHTDGPYNVYSCPDLPQPGDVWDFQTDDDSYAYCQYETRVYSMQSKPQDPTKWWLVEKNFSTIPFDRRCMSTLPGNPTMEPAKVSGNFTKYTKEGTYDLNGNLIANTALQPIKGQVVEFDNNRLTITIEQNIPEADFEPSTWNQYVNSVNNDTLWGFSARQIKLANMSFDRRIYGNCSVYFVRKSEFEICSQAGDTWDVLIPNYSTKVLSGAWKADGSGTWVPTQFPGYGGAATTVTTGAITLVGGTTANYNVPISNGASFADSTYVYISDYFPPNWAAGNNSLYGFILSGGGVSGATTLVVEATTCPSGNNYGNPRVCGNPTSIGTGSMVSQSQNPDPYNPDHYIDFFDKNRRPTRALLVSGGTRLGQPAQLADIPTNSQLLIQYYPSQDFLDLNIPTSLTDATLT